jgi:hypothetical protein
MRELSRAITRTGKMALRGFHVDIPASVEALKTLLRQSVATDLCRLACILPDSVTLRSPADLARGMLQLSQRVAVLDMGVARVADGVVVRITAAAGSSLAAPADNSDVIIMASAVAAATPSSSALLGTGPSSRAVPVARALFSLPCAGAARVRLTA